LMNDFLMPGLVLLGVTVGALLAWLLSRGRTRSLVDAAVARSETSAQSELAQLRERVRAGDEARRTDRAAYDALKLEAESLRNDLDEERDETAKLTERATRVPVLEQETGRLAEELRLSGVELLRVSNEAAQKGQAVASMTDQLADLEAANRSLAEKLASANEALTAAAERKATLEEQTGRIPGLERDLSTATTEIDRLGTQLTEVREAAGAETARLVAERSAHGLVRDDLAQVKLAVEAAEALVASLNTQLTELREANGVESARLTAEREAHGLVRSELALEKAGRESAEADVGRLNGELTELRTKLDAEREGAAEKLALLVNAKEALTDQFKTLATDILEEKSKRFAEQNQATLGQLLDPLRTQLSEFKGKVEEVYVQESNGRAALSEQVKSLVTLNQTLSQDAKNLTLALKGQAKTQGNWGELILERVLEASGLKKGHEYKVQDSQVREDGTRAQPDVVIELPEERKLVVDAKVSLVAYDRYVSAETDEERVVALREHLASVRGHIKGLSEKKYHSLYGLQSLDFVLAFVPIEPAFMLAVTNDNDLFMDAWQRNVLLVSPSTLLFVVRTVAHLWRQEAQSRNSQEIAERGAALYDKLSGFVVDLQKVGDRLRLAKEAFDDAQGKLSTGKGNVIRQAEMLRELGVKPTKALPAPLVQASASHDDIVVPDLAALSAPLVNGTTDALSDPM
jgi:DNA recombination protein RmuC